MREERHRKSASHLIDVPVLVLDSGFFCSNAHSQRHVLLLNHRQTSTFHAPPNSKSIAHPSPPPSSFSPAASCAPPSSAPAPLRLCARALIQCDPSAAFHPAVRFRGNSIVNEVEAQHMKLCNHVFVHVHHPRSARTSTADPGAAYRHLHVAQFCTCILKNPAFTTQIMRFCF